MTVAQHWRSLEYLDHDARYLAHSTGIALGWLQGPYEGKAFLAACEKCGISFLEDLRGLSCEEKKLRWGDFYEDEVEMALTTSLRQAGQEQNCPHWEEYQRVQGTEPALAGGFLELLLQEAAGLQGPCCRSVRGEECSLSDEQYVALCTALVREVGTPERME